MRLNLCPIKFDSDNYTLHRMAFKNDDHYNDLKEKYRKDNTIFKSEGFIYCSPNTEENPFSEEESITLSISKDIEITQLLIHHIIFRKIYSNETIVTEFNPINFFLHKKKESRVLSNFINGKLKSQIGFWKGYKIDTRHLIVNDNVYYAAILNSFYEWKIKISCKTILEKDKFFDLVNKYVVLYNKRHLLKGKRELIGKIIEINGDVALVQKDDESNKYKLDEIFLENSYENRELLVPLLLGKENSQNIFKYIKESNGNRKGAKGQISDIEYLESVFVRERIKFSNRLDFKFRIDSHISSNSDLWKKIPLIKPVFIFNEHGTQKDTWHDKGLRTHGPYSRNNLTLNDNVPKIVVIGRKTSQGAITKFIEKFKDGLPQIQTSGYYPYQPFGQGFVTKYHLGGIDLSFYWVENISISEFGKVVRKAIEENNSIDLAIIESCKMYKTLDDSKNPYFFTKAKFLIHGIPSQDVLYENMILPDKSLAYLLNNISLASYAKIGGKPWITPKESNTDHELVIGIGNKIFKKGRFDFDRRIVGITTFFSSNGDFIMTSTSKDVPYEDYLSELKQSLLFNIERIKSKENWIESDTVRLIFHVFKPCSNEEIDIIEEITSTLKEKYNILFAYLTFSEKHPILLFDPDQKGVSDFKNYGKQKGIGVAHRMTTIRLSNHQALIQLIGPNEVKTYLNGMPRPLLIKLHKRSSFDSLDYLVRQIYEFSCISWRSFFPSSMPVTIEYSNQVANQLGNLRKSGHWNQDILDHSLKYKAWFL